MASADRGGEMKLFTLTVEATHPNAYRPLDCKTANVTDIYWDANYGRIVVELRYTNGAIDFIPLSEIQDGVYEVVKP